MSSKKIKVVELFAGVGGFRVGLEASKGPYEVVWSNQWEPSTKKQHASLVYEARFGSQHHSSSDIATVPTKEIPDHDLLVGGFPCQDYSVATTLTNSKGILGKKGVLWWSIHRILKEKKRKPKFLLLENVGRLLKSPAKQRGRDFAVMLKSLDELGYAIEWRVINAADYGMPQRRRRIFFIGYHKSTVSYKSLKKDPESWMIRDGIMINAFSAAPLCPMKTEELNGDLVEVSDGFNKDGKVSPFMDAGVMIKSKILTCKMQPEYGGKKVTLGDIIVKKNIPDACMIESEDLDRWQYFKGAKKEVRTTKEGYQYNYSEGSMSFPDALDRPSRTIITGEGGPSPSRFKHVIKTRGGYRRLTPIELERLNMFPDDHTKLDGISDSKRAFFMGNALVTGVVRRIGDALNDHLKS